MELLGIVPARGGSLRVRRKNLQIVAGKPLVLHAAETLADLCDRVVVTTDDVEVESVALTHGFEVHRRDRVDDEQTIPECAQLVANDLNWDGPVLLLQPTVPYPGDLTATPAIPPVAFADGDRARIGTVSDTRHRHRSWFEHAAPSVNLRTGIYYWPHPPYNEVPKWAHAVDPSAGLDIDTVDDLTAARRIADAKRILIQYDDTPTVGSGHKARMHTLADNLQHHDISLMSTTDDPPDGWFDMVITDTLDDRRLYGLAPLWVAFESRTATDADLVVNALYAPSGLPNEVTGLDWAILRPEFRNLPDFDIFDTGRVLIMLGTDASNLLPRAIDAVEPYGWRHTVVTEPVPVAATMRNHDLLITNAGRTLVEACAVGIPAVVLAENVREATHRHIGPDYGNVYLGLDAEAKWIRRKVQWLISRPDVRREMSRQARSRIDGRGLDRIVYRIDGLLRGVL